MVKAKETPSKSKSKAKSMKISKETIKDLDAKGEKGVKGGGKKTICCPSYISA
jgi:hypothetical protein